MDPFQFELALAGVVEFDLVCTVVTVEYGRIIEFSPG